MQPLGKDVSEQLARVAAMFKVVRTIRRKAVCTCCNHFVQPPISGVVEPAAVWFAYSPDRKGIHPQSHLARFEGILQADAYGGFNELYTSGKIREAACWDHARRKLYEVHVSTP